MRVVSWNIHSCRGLDGAVSLDRVAETLTHLDADIIALQEVRAYSGLNQPRELARRLGMATAFQRNVVRPRYRFGNAVMVRGDLLGYANVRLPGGWEPRGMLLVQAATAAGAVWAASVHVGLTARERIVQKAAILQTLPADKPALVLGDFNERPTELGAIAEALQLADPVPTFPAAKPVAAIDFLLSSDHWRVEDRFIVPTTASDHVPLVVDLSLRKGPGKGEFSALGHPCGLVLGHVRSH